MVGQSPAISRLKAAFHLGIVFSKDFSSFLVIYVGIQSVGIQSAERRSVKITNEFINNNNNIFSFFLQQRQQQQ